MSVTTLERPDSIETETGPAVSQPKIGSVQVIMIANRAGVELGKNGRPQFVPGGLTMVALPPVTEASKQGQDVTWIGMAQTLSDFATLNNESRSHSNFGPNSLTEFVVGKAFRAKLNAEGTQESPFYTKFIGVPKQFYDAYYKVFANEVLWPAMHGFKSTVSRQEIMDNYQASKRVWKTQAKAIVESIKPGADAVVQIHDYQLMPLGKYVKEELEEYNRGLAPERQKSCKMIGFHHIPVCSVDEFLEALKETREHHPIATELLEAMDSMPWAFHSDDWRDNYLELHRVLRGREVFQEVDFEPIVQPALIDPRGLAAEGKSVDWAVNELQERLDGFEGRKFNGEVITLVGRADPKNGLVAALDAIAEVVKELPDGATKPAVLLCASRTRKGAAPYDAEWIAIQAAEERLRELLGDRMIRIAGVDAQGNHDPELPNRPSTVAAQRLATVNKIASARGGRDIVGQEAVAVKQPGDPAVVVIASAHAKTSETLREFPSRAAVRYVRNSEGELICGPNGKPVVVRLMNGNHMESGAVIANGIGPEVDPAERVEILSKCLRHSMAMPADERIDRFHAMQESIRLESPRIWWDRLMTGALDQARRMRIDSRDLRKPLFLGVEPVRTECGTCSPSASGARRRANSLHEDVTKDTVDRPFSKSGAVARNGHVTNVQSRYDTGQHARFGISSVGLSEIAEVMTTEQAREFMRQGPRLSYDDLKILKPWQDSEIQATVEELIREV